MDFKSKKSSGNLLKVFPIDVINEIENQIEKFLLDLKESPNVSQKCYSVKDKLDRITYLTRIEEIINISKFAIYFEEVISEIVINPEKYFLASSEMHIRWPNCEAIPPHQDNFYHCFQDIKSFKILIPISKFEHPNAYLNYAKVKICQKTLNHIASSTPAFSSYIPKEIISNLDLQWINYKFNLGDIIWHSINSIHYAEQNLTNNKTVFLVFRFDNEDSIIDKKMLNKYNEVFEKHKKMLNLPS